MNMSPENLQLLLNGIACISDAVNCHFTEVITALKDGGVLDEQQADAVREA